MKIKEFSEFYFMDVDIPVTPSSLFFPAPMSTITLKRKRTFRSGRKPAAKRMRVARGSINQQAMRTGGWASPSSMRRGELKFTDVGAVVTLTAASTAFSTGNLLNGIVPGSGADQRIGRKIIMKSLMLRWFVTLGATSAQGSPIRILIIHDKQANAVAPAVTDILLTNEFLSVNNLSNRDRFTVLLDKITAPIGTQNNFCIGGKKFKRFSLETIFNAGAAGTIGDITSGSVYLFVAQAGNIITGNAQFNFRTRIRYTD